MPATLDATDEADAMTRDGIAVPGVRPSGDFPDTEFVTYRNVPIFAEHRTTSSSGRELVFTRAELEAVCSRCNQRIADTGDYATIIIGHTPDPAALASGQAKPSPVVGFAGPFRMGKIGEGDAQKWAILADFHIYRNQPEVIRLYPRRSPELWLQPNYEDMFLDPIALLGGEAPRLDMGLLYTAVKDGQRIEKYAAVSPGPMNSSLPVFGERDPKNVKKFDSQTQRSQAMAISTEDLKQIVDAISQTEVFAWAKSQMEASKDKGGSESDDDKKPEEYAAADDDQGDDEDDEENKMVKENYAKQAREIVKLEGTVAALQRQLSTETAKRIDGERYSKLSGLAERFAFDLAEEFEEVRYGKADDAAFDRHCDRITRRYQPIIVGVEPTVPEGVEMYSRAPGQDANKAKYSRDQIDRAKAVAIASVNKGVPMSFDAALEMVASGKA